jgi:SHS2 domain-containing protein
MFRCFEHTADLGLRIEAPDLDGLFRDAARALFSIIAEPEGDGRPGEALRLEIAGTRRDDLLFDWLNELLYLFDSRQLLLDRFEVDVAADGLRATARGRPLDVDRDRLLHEVKAITYHELKVEQSEDGWLAEVIVDI